MDMKILFDLLKEVREDQKNHGRELSKQSAYLENLDSDVKELKVSVLQNTEDISHHIRRTDILQELHKDNQKRIANSEERLDKLEEPVKARKWLKKNTKSVKVILSIVLITVSILAFFLNK